MPLQSSSLITTLLETDLSPNNIVLYFLSIIALTKKYWKKLYSEKILNNIQAVEPILYSLLKILLHYKKSSISDIQHIIQSIQKQDSAYIPTFTVYIPQQQHTNTIEHYIKNKFPNSQTNIKSSIDLWISIVGEWRHYNRNIDQDIQKLLG
jgi:hypothetical protein